MLVNETDNTLICFDIDNFLVPLLIGCYMKTPVFQEGARCVSVRAHICLYLFVFPKVVNPPIKSLMKSYLEMSASLGKH